MKSLTFEPIHEAQSVRTGAVLLHVLQERKLNVLASCGGQGLCATCHVRVRGGGEALSPRNEREKRTLSFIAGTGPDSRLACQSRVHGDGLVIELPRGMYIEKGEDLLDLLGTRAEQDILHPIKGTVLIASGKLITRTRIEELRNLEAEVAQAREGTRILAPLATPTVSEAPHSTFNVQRQAATPTPPPPSVTFSSATFSGSRSGPKRTRTTRGLEIGMQLGKCQLLEKLGAGSSGTVFRALHRTLNIAVAVKVLKLPETDSLDGADEATVRERLRDEARLMAQLNHKHIVRVWDFDDEHEFPHVVLELVEGLSLAQLIQQSGRIAPPQAVALTRQVALALEAAWSLGVVHRDVKPGNILLDREGVAKLADLGLACSVEANAHRPKAAAGTVAYMAPEQALGQDIDHRSDIYALGATLFHMVTGRLPFPGASWQEVIYKHTNQPLDSPEDHAPGLGQNLSDLIVTMMMKDPMDRPQSYRELRDALDELAEPTPPRSPAPRTARLAAEAPSSAKTPLMTPVPPRSRWIDLFRGMRSK